MRTIIAGSRTITNFATLLLAIEESNFTITSILCGCARGVDTLGEQFGKHNKIPITYFAPDWDTYGKSAAIRRNTQMAQNADALLAIWDGQSRGTAHMISEAKRLNLKLHIYIIK